ncbi:MAG: hypothetical protein ACI4NA_03095, partial [Succinivibrio sp.]
VEPEPEEPSESATPVEPEPAEPSEPATPAKPDPEEPSEPAAPSDQEPEAPAGQGSGGASASGGGTGSGADGKSPKEGAEEPSSRPDGGDGGKASGGYVEISDVDVAAEECGQAEPCRILTARIRFSEYSRKREKMHTMRLRVPALPSDVLASAREATRRAIAGLFSPSASPDPLSGGKQKAAA